MAERSVCEAIRTARSQRSLIGRASLKMHDPSPDIGIVLDSDARGRQFAKKAQLDING